MATAYKWTYDNVNMVYTPPSGDLGGSYVSTTGSNANPGTYAEPWLTPQYGFSQLSAGDTLYIRGGTYSPTSTVVSGAYCAVGISNVDGTAVAPITVRNYPGETVIISGANITENGERAGILLTLCAYWYIRGITVTGIAQHASGDVSTGIYILYGTHITLERCVAHHNGGVGINASFECDDITYLNCDSYANADPYTVADPYGNADGFGLGEHLAGTTFLMRGCRAWNNSDDGFDVFATDGYVTFDKCWAWHNGYREDQLTTGGDGNGFKLGDTNLADGSIFLRTVQNCLSFQNRMDGFGTNSAICLIRFYNSTAYANGNVGFRVTGPDIAYVFRNLVSFGNAFNFDGHAFPNNYIVDHNSYDAVWQPLGPVASAADFVSISSADVTNSRQSNGNLPVITFLHPTAGSDLINAGVNVGVVTDGDGQNYDTPPSIGAFEY